ncbi:MAG TPA: hypothetical protein PKA33_20740 [Amaricoccus sp.]|uniref:hypothetical protein n=1 Tax=Amaricoccus sp. TaxID=1872485 RepID=UPI002B5B185C|nr:hypothetical protein [Amaricoccus sp.]HMQ94624.1 hypothetical protein [Amaricoccus sp.]HMR54745.1 hypothetical protein [Amaricoccus sp.]HMR61692.1 hypothetical protein [Amaricoccus sp.]HMU01757.1 hypothetical protein [Amaricoccus sp.]
MGTVLDFPYIGIARAREIVEHPDLHDAATIRAACETLIKFGTDDDFRAVQNLQRARIINRLEQLNSEFSRRQSKALRFWMVLILTSSAAFWILLGVLLVGAVLR